jgi:fatty-acyl-CoA synthase
MSAMSGQLTRGCTYADLIVAAFARHGDHPAFVHDTRIVTYREMHGQLLRFAAALTARGIGRGDGFTVLGRNRPDVLAAVAAGIVSGAHYVPLNPAVGAAENAGLLARSGVSVLLFEPGLLDERIPTLAAGARVEEVLGIGPSDAGDDLVELASQVERPPTTPAIDESDLALILHTGGTTGRPKAVMLSHRAMSYAALLMAGQWQWPLDLRLAAIPQLAQGLLVPVALRGGTVVLVPGTSPDELLRAIADHRATVTYFPATGIYGLLEAAGTRGSGSQAGTDSLDTILYGATPIPPVCLQEAIRTFGSRFMQAYSLAEASVVTVLRKEEHDVDRLDRLASCGRPVAGIDVAVQDATGRKVPPGEVGEICVRGKVVMDGYLHDRAGTESAFRGDWLHTGDFARRDDEGFLHILGRREDLLREGSVPARDVENVLATHPAVTAAAVFALPATGGNDIIAAAVVGRAADQLDIDELTRFASARLPRTHVPSRIQVVRALPLTPNGKPDKTALQDAFVTA